MRLRTTMSRVGAWLVYQRAVTSNHVGADWLGEPGCDVEGPAYAARWQVRSPA